MDVLAPGLGEIIGGSQREERYDFLIDKIQTPVRESGGVLVVPWLRKFGTAPHAGFGLGPDA